MYATCIDTCSTLIYINYIHLQVRGGGGGGGGPDPPDPPPLRPPLPRPVARGCKRVQLHPLHWTAWQAMNIIHLIDYCSAILMRIASCESIACTEAELGGGWRGLGPPAISACTVT